MNTREDKYARYSLCREMLQTPEVIRNFDDAPAGKFSEALNKGKRVFLTGEGSSRILPAKRALYNLQKKGTDLAVYTDGGAQALEYELSDSVVFGASNSGRTKELVRLFSVLSKSGHKNLYGITANSDTPLEKLSAMTHILSCGKENAVAATKSVVEQSLFYDALFSFYRGDGLTDKEKEDAADSVEKALEMRIDENLIRDIAEADTVYFAGRNNGVAEELTLKTNEITHKRSGFLEGTYAVHGIEEVMSEKDVVIIIDPFEDEQEKFKSCLIDGVGLKIIAIATHPTLFPTILIPEAGFYRNYTELAAGWNILVETGLFLGINLDKAERARKVGNEFTLG